VSAEADLDLTIAAQEAKLQELDRKHQETERRLRELRALRDVAPSEGNEQLLDASANWSPQRKLALFASLFRGREDVFPLRWENARRRSGWAPRCRNEWKPGVCGKPRVRCGVCPNQAFVTVSEGELRAHLQGRQVMGLYPLLTNDTCWLLAIDLDGRSWREDVIAMVEACREFEVVPAVERSRSGEGAHVWFFFAAPVAAALARRFGLMLLTRAMARSPTLGMSSYDRLFPSQDTLPRGGFGNLIALPLQREARQRGNTVFLDERLEPYDDQWTYLDSLPRLTADRLESLVLQGDGGTWELGVRGERRGSNAPWRPAQSLADQLAAEPLPQAVSATLSGRLYVRRDGLPAPLVDAIRRLATFSNPQFLERQRLRLSTARVPRVIACFEQVGDFLALPRGCREPLADLLAGVEVRLELSDERSDGGELDATFDGELTLAQEAAAGDMLGHELGVLCAPPGAGKTVIAARLIAARERATLVLVHRQPLLEQWLERLIEFLDLDREAVGVIGAGKSKPTGRVDVAMVQSLARRERLEEALAGYGHVVIDECHHVPAVTTERVLRAAASRYLLGLTATPKRRDGHHPIIAMQCGPVRHEIKEAGAHRGQSLELRVVRRDTPFDPSSLPTDPSIHEIYGAIAADERRTALIVRDTLELVAKGHSPIVLTERREHLERLAANLADRIPTPIVLHGDMRPAARRKALAELAEAASDAPRVVLATGRYIGEGFDNPRLDTLVLAMPIAWKGTVVQYAGRLHRAHPGKCETLVYDYVDNEVPVLRRMFAKRLSAYRSLGYELAEAA
jgi:superfamily II DNA or RNA helicase